MKKKGKIKMKRKIKLNIFHNREKSNKNINI